MGQHPESQTGTTLQVLLRDPSDPAAWKAFVERYTPKLMGWCGQWHLQPADAQDVTQEVLYKLAQQMRRLPYDPGKGRFRSWLKTLARHAWSDLRDHCRQAGWGSGDPRIEGLLQQQEDQNGLLEALDEEFMREVYEEAKARVRLRVSANTWQAFQLLVIEGLSGAEVAARLKMKVATVYVAKNRAQTMLAEEIRKLEGSGSERSKEPP